MYNANEMQLVASDQKWKNSIIYRKYRNNLQYSAGV